MIRKVGNGPIDLARFKYAIVPRAAVGAAIEPLDPEVPKTLELDGQRPALAATPPLKHSVRRQKEAFTIPGVRRRPAGRQHIRGVVENGPFPFMLRAINDQVLASLICTLAPAASKENSVWRPDQVAIVQIEQQYFFGSALHIGRSVNEYRS